MPAPIEKLLKVGFNFRQAEAIHALGATSTSYEARTTARVASLVADTVLAVDSVVGLAEDDVVILARGTAAEETATITAVDATVDAETITVAALSNAHEIGDAVEAVVVTDTPPTFRQLVQASFSPNQTRALLQGTSSTPPAFVVLVRQGKFTRHQAKLIRES